MAKLSNSDHALLLTTVQQIFAQTNYDELPHTMIALLKAAIPCEVIAFNRAHPVTNEVAVVHNYHDPAFVQKLFPVLMEHIGEHGVYQHHLETGSVAVRKITDFVSQNKFERTGLYNEFFRQVGIRSQMSLYLPRTSEYVIALTLQRSKGDFTERDRLMLEQLQTAFGQAHQNALVLQRLTGQTQFLTQTLTAIGQPTAFVSGQGIIEWISSVARELIQEFFGHDGFTCLPQRVSLWLSSGSFSPLIISLPTKQLHIRKFPLSPSTWALVFAKEVPLAREHFAHLGLTPREGEALRWLGEGKTNPEIAIILGISVRTVHKHVERIFLKLGVENRQSALLKILQSGHR